MVTNHVYFSGCLGCIEKSFHHLAIHGQLDHACILMEPTLYSRFVLSRDFMASVIISLAVVVFCGYRLTSAQIICNTPSSFDLTREYNKRI